MSAVEERKAIGTLFNAGWAGATPVAWPGQKFDPPQNGSWVRLTFTQGDAFQVEMGPTNAQKRALGLLTIQVFTALGRGDRDALQLADSAAQIFRDSRRVSAGQHGDLLFRVPVVRPIGEDAAGLYYQVNVSVPYVHESVD